uniref:Uncharacterized protein n=1 Tax=viral metagenome TaxID=1070528 RepID=A0A6C0BP26_9ZZZZ
MEGGDHPNRFNKPPPLDGLASKPPNRTVDNWVEARNIYNSYLHDVLVPVVYEVMHSVYQDAVNFSASKRPEDIEKTFMDFLVETRVWSIPIIKGETDNILKYCPWFSKLLKGVFVSNVMVLSSAQLNRQNAPPAKIPLEIPQCQVFVQALYSNVAARLFNHPNIFRTQGLTSDQIIEKRNLAYREIETAIDATVRRLIPLPQVIESSMNFTGNHPVITARAPPPVPAPPMTNTRGAGRISQRAVEQQRAHFPSKPRTTPPVPARKTQPPPPPPATTRKSEKPVSAISFSKPRASARPISEHNEFRQSRVPSERKPERSRTRIASENIRSVEAQLDLGTASDHSASSSSLSSRSSSRLSDDDEEQVEYVSLNSISYE